MDHVEDFRSDGSQDGQYYESYEDLSVHRVMLADRPRMDFYRRILTDLVVVGGRVVVDVGSGSGVLSSWAAMSGSKHVFSIEASSMADLQPLIFQENGLAARVTVLHSTVEALVEAGPEAFVAAHGATLSGSGVGLIVSEWMGFYLVHEGMLPSVLAARDFFAAVNALLGVATEVEMVPSSARLLAAPISLEPLYRHSFQTFWGSVEGVKMETLGRMAFELTVNGASPLVEIVPADCLLVDEADAAVLWERDLASLTAEDLQAMEATASFRPRAPADEETPSPSAVSIDGFVLWFDVRYRDVVLDTSPTSAPTHWKQTSVLLPAEAREEKLVTLAALQSDPLDIKFTLRMSEPGSRYYTIEFELC